MQRRDFRKKFTEGTGALPIVWLLTAIAWILPNFQDRYLWLGLALLSLMTYVVIEWNNQNQLLRVRSRMNSVVFLSFMCAFPQLHAVSLHWIPAFCLLAAYFVLFRGYGQISGRGTLFHAFLLLGIGSLVFPPLLLFLPFFYTSAGRQLRILSFSSFCAGFWGYILPYWLAAGIVFVLSSFSLSAQFTSFFTPYLQLPDYSSIKISSCVGVACVVFLGGISILHFLRTAYNDKIRTRQYYYVLLVQQLPLLSLWALYPNSFDILMPIQIVLLTPFISHYFTLAKGRLVDLFFAFSIALLATLAVFNYLDLWMQFLPF